MLRRNFLYCLPHAIEKRKHNYILNVEGTSCQKLTYDQIVRLASQHHRECVNEQDSSSIGSEVSDTAQMKTSIAIPNRRASTGVTLLSVGRQRSQPNERKTKTPSVIVLEDPHTGIVVATRMNRRVIVLMPITTVVEVSEMGNKLNRSMIIARSSVMMYQLVMSC